MTLKPFEKPWANSAASQDLLEPTDDNRADGWKRGYRVESNKWNYKIRELDLKVNDTIAERNLHPCDIDVSTIETYSTDIDDYRKALSSGSFLWDTCKTWGWSDDPNNVIELASTYYQDIMPIWIDDEVYIAALSRRSANLGEIHIYNARSKSQLSYSGALSSIANALDTTGSQTYEPLSMCTDGIDFYVVFRDTNPSPDEYYVQSFSYDSSTDTWSKKSLWPNNGLAIGSGAISYNPSIIISSSNGTDMNRVAIACTWEDLDTAPTDPGVRVVNTSNGTVVTSGCGGATTAANNKMMGGITCDGTSIYFTYYYDAGVNGYSRAASCGTNDATASGGLLDCNLSNGNDGHRCNNIIYLCDDRLIAVNDVDSGGQASGDNIMDYFDLSERADGPIESCYLGDLLGVTDSVWNRWGEYIQSVTFDGDTLYVLTTPTKEKNTPDYCLVVTAISINSISLQAGYSPNFDYFDYLDTRKFIIEPTSSVAPVQAGWHSLCFDGRDLWVTYYFDSDTAHKIYRIPNIKQR